MKKNIIFLTLAGIALCFASATAQSYYDDDIYYDSSKATKKPVKKSQVFTNPSTVVVAEYPSADSYAASVNGTRTISVDDYNRRGIFANDSLTNDTTATDFAYTRRIEQFYNPQIVSGSGDKELANIYYMEPDEVNIYINTPSGYWGYDYFYPAFSYYSPYWNPGWRWGSPWYWNSWYDPYWTWGPSWGWGPGWGWNFGFSWGWGPGWGPSWGWSAPAWSISPRQSPRHFGARFNNHNANIGVQRPASGNTHYNAVANRYGSRPTLNGQTTTNGGRVSTQRQPASVRNQNSSTTNRNNNNGYNNRNSGNSTTNGGRTSGYNSNTTNPHQSSGSSWGSGSGSSFGGSRSSGGSYGGGRSSGGGRGRH